MHSVAADIFSLSKITTTATDSKKFKKANLWYR